MTEFSIEVESGPVVGILKQEGQHLDRWEDLDLSKPWFWAPPENSEPIPSEPWASTGWTEIGATVED